MNDVLEWDDPIDGEIYGYLNDKPPTSFMLYAGAGSGKTKTLVSVLDSLRRNHAQGMSLSGKKVAVVTYTNAACEEIKERLKNDPIFQVSTIHSFSWELIKGFTSDIRAWLQIKLAADIQELDADIKKARNQEGVTAQKNIRARDKKIQRLNTLKNVLKFSYTPNSFSDNIGALNHSEVVDMAAFFLRNESLMAKIFINHYPVFLIDETQDTHEELLNSIIFVQENYPQDFCIGLFGDTMQRIYGGGKKNLKETLPDSWRKPEKKVNHRCPKRVVKLINKIRIIDDSHQQIPREDAEDGTVAFFIIDTKKSLSKTACEEIVRRKMSDLSKDSAWRDRKHVKTLTLEHHMAAVRGGFDDFLLPFLSIDYLKDKVLKAEGQDIKFLLSVLLPLVNSIKYANDFDVATIFRKHSPLLSSVNLKNSLDPMADIRFARDAIEEIRESLNISKKFSIMELLKIIENKKLFILPSNLSTYLIDPTLSAQEEGDKWEDKESVAWASALQSSIDQLEKYALYRSDSSDFGTHQGVKGLQYDRVMVILDDEEARGFLFSYERLLGATPPTPNDLKNEKEGKDSSSKRSRRLFYVTCSRAKKSLAVVAYSKNPASVKKHVVESDWFKEDEIIEINDDSELSLSEKDRKILQKRIPLESAEFTETINDIDGYAKGWFFLVGSAFRPALDIAFTKGWTEGFPPFYQFRSSDGIESRSGKWYIQVQRAISDSQSVQGSVDINIYASNEQTPTLRWIKVEQHTLTQKDFVDLLRTGKCNKFSLLEE